MSISKILNKRLMGLDTKIGLHLDLWTKVKSDTTIGFFTYRFLFVANAFGIANLGGI